MFLVDATHQGGSWRQDLIDEDEDGLFRRQLDSLADHVDELSYGQVGGDKIFLLVDGRDVGLFDFFADHLEETSVSEVVQRRSGVERESGD